jgi:3',5'-nucleoside bisphosphate phosphatase
MNKSMLLCDFHIHTNFSDGRMPLHDVIDLYGNAGFDVIAITDHAVDTGNVLGMIAKRMKMSILESNFSEYINSINMEAARAWDKYNMLVLPGVEISKNYFKSDNSAHFLVLDIKEFIPPNLDYLEIFRLAREQSSLIIACHPHHTKRSSTRDTLYLWNHRKMFASYIDAWEIANRDDLFSVIGLKKYPYIANSDFHRHRHLFSWKTLLDCEKTAKAVKSCIKENRNVSVMLFRR